MRSNCSPLVRVRADNMVNLNPWSPHLSTITTQITASPPACILGLLLYSWKYLKTFWLNSYRYVYVTSERPWHEKEWEEYTIISDMRPALFLKTCMLLLDSLRQCTYSLSYPQCFALTRVTKGKMAEDGKMLGKRQRWPICRCFRSCWFLFSLPAFSDLKTGE